MACTVAVVVPGSALYWSMYSHRDRPARLAAASVRRADRNGWMAGSSLQPRTTCTPSGRTALFTPLVTSVFTVIGSPKAIYPGICLWT